VAEIVVLNGSCAGTVFVLPDIPTVLGRSPESHLQIGDPWISSMHAMFERRGDHVWVIDLESRNGTFVGDERVGEASVRDGALLRFGRTEVRFAAVSTWEEPDPLTPRKEERPRELQRDTIRADTTCTMTTRAPAPREPELDPYALALRPATVLRLSLHAVGVAGAPDAATRIRAALDACARAAVAEGGFVSRLGGIGLLVLYGLTGPSAEDAACALRSARSARGHVRAIGGLELRAGVDLGPVLAGNTGSASGSELCALGAPADRAERLVALAAPGEILAGAGAAAAAPTGLAKVGMREVGGSPIEVWRDERL
jgi:pSer/pThr/pTyr-binding forkhead associated (FHA) protein